MSAGSLVLFSAAGIAMIAAVFVFFDSRREPGAHRKHDPVADAVHEAGVVTNSVSTIPTQALPADQTIPNTALIGEVVAKHADKPDLSHLAVLHIQVDDYVRWVDPADSVDDPDDWLNPLITGGTRAERRLTGEFKSRGWLVRRTPRKQSKRVKRNLRKEAEHADD